MKIKTIDIFSLCVSIAICLASTSVFAEQLMIPGTGASAVILRELAAAFNAENPGSEVIIPPSVGSGGGIRLVGTGEKSLGRVARPLKDEELHYDLSYLAFARDMVVFAVGQRAGVKNLSSQQLADVFSGKMAKWQQVGGNDVPVRLLIRESEDSSLLILRQKLEGFKDLVFSKRAKILFHDSEMVNALNKYTTAIGWLTNSSMKDIDSEVVTISIDGILPIQENVYDGKYVFHGDYALVYKKKNLNGLARKFVKFIFSKESSRILVSAGLVPVNGHQY